jgi:hypothetical protein
MKTRRSNIFSVLGGRHILAGVAVLPLVSSCGPSYQAPPVTGDLVRISRSSSELLERGYIVHQQKCAKCHPFENPAHYDEDELIEDIMPDMAEKSKLDAADEKAVLAYVLAVRRMPQPVAAP